MTKQSGLLAGATALALVFGSAGFAQQTTTQDTDQTQTDQQQVQAGGQQNQQMEQAIADLRIQMQQLRQAVEEQNFDQAEQALQQAEQALEDAQMASQQSAQQQDDQQQAQADEQQDDQQQAQADEQQDDQQQAQADDQEETGDNVDVTIVPADEAEQATAEATTQEEGTAATLSPEQTQELLALGDQQIGEATETLMLTPLDLTDRDVYTMDGDEVGEIDEVVSSNGQFYAIVAHGGFLGIGEDRVAVPLDRIGIRGEEVILLGLSEEQLGALPDFDYMADEVLPQDQEIQIGRYE